MQVIGEDAGTGEKLAGIILEHYNNTTHTQMRGNSTEIARDRSPGGGKLPLLFLVGEQHRDVVPKTLMSAELPADRRIGIEELIVYETGVMESFENGIVDALREVGAWEKDTREDEDETRRMVGSKGTYVRTADEEGGAKEDDDEGAIWIVVFSPTGCDTLLRVLNLLPWNNEREHSNARLGRNCYIATIGPTTRDHLRSQFGVEADVCAERPSPEGLGSGIEAFMARRREQRKTERVPGK